VRLATVEDLKAGVEDRAYRLHYNQGQNRADLFAQAGCWLDAHGRGWLARGHATRWLLEPSLFLFYSPPVHPPPLQIGMAAGGAATVAFLPASAAVVVGSAAAGAACGIVAHVATARSREE
jgi:hypothetical protein